jgi:hypothetical protein
MDCERVNIWRDMALAYTRIRPEWLRKAVKNIMNQDSQWRGTDSNRSLPEHKPRAVAAITTGMVTYMWWCWGLTPESSYRKTSKSRKQTWFVLATREGTADSLSYDSEICTHTGHLFRTTLLISETLSLSCDSKWNMHSYWAFISYDTADFWNLVTFL